MAPSLTERWNRIRTEFALRDLIVDVVGKVLVGLGIGVLLAASLAPYAWVFIVGGLSCSVIVKAKYWKRFWS